MKQFFSKKSFVRLATLMLLMVFAASCNDDENEVNGGSDDTSKRVEVSRINGYQNITLPEKSSWQVTENPEWAVPMQESGDANTTLQLFVETNDEEADRTGKLIVKQASGKTCTYELYQIGTLRDDNNGVLTDVEDLRLTYGVGYSLNALEPVSNKMFKYPVKNTSPYNFAKLLNAFKEIGNEDALSSEDYVISKTVNITGESTSEIASQLALNDNIDAEMNAFKLTVDGYYNVASSSNDKYEYAIQKIQHFVSARKVDANTLKLFAKNGNDNIYQSRFRNFIKKLKENPNDKKTMNDIVKCYGTHLIIYGALGGELSVAMQMRKTDEITSSDISVALELSTKAINGGISEFDMSNKERSVASNTTVSLTSYGGQNVFVIAPGTIFENYMRAMSDETKMNIWLESVMNGTSLALIGIEAMPIWELMPTDEIRDALHKYIVEDYQRKYFGEE